MKINNISQKLDSEIDTMRSNQNVSNIDNCNSQFKNIFLDFALANH